MISQCPHHCLEKVRLVQILYEGLDYSTTTMVESLCTGEFENKTVDEAMTFLNEIADKTQQWENNREPQKTILLSRGNVNRV